MKSEEIKALFEQFEQASSELEGIAYHFADVSKMVEIGLNNFSSYTAIVINRFYFLNI